MYGLGRAERSLERAEIYRYECHWSHASRVSRSLASRATTVSSPASLLWINEDSVTTHGQPRDNERPISRPQT